MNLEFGNYRYFWLIILVLALIFLLYSFLKWRKKKQNLFAEKPFKEKIFGQPSKRGRVVPIIYILAFVMLVLAFVDVVKNESKEIEIDQKTSNIIFLLDVSNSMNAQDIEPSRLEQSKQILNKTLSKLTSEKVGIVVFAGEAQSMMPLITDYSSVNLYLENINSTLIKRQGTDFLLAVEEANKRLKNANFGAKKIVLISDGEDNEANHNAAIAEAKRQNVSITTVGVGTEEGATIPEIHFNLYEDFKKDQNGEVVITKRETQALKSIARQTNAVYIDGNQLDIAVSDIVKDIQSMEKQTQVAKMMMKNTIHYYQWFLGVALFLWFLIYFINPKKDLNL